MNDVLDALNSRIKSPYFGYSVLAFLGLNWRGLFLLATFKGTAHERIAAFDAQTSHWTLIVLPLLVGAAIALLSPWIRYCFGYLSRVPLELGDNLSLNLEHKKALTQSELERTRSDMFSAKEDELIERAKRDEKIAEIDNEEVQARLNSQIDDLRKERDQLSEQVKSQIVALHDEPELSLAATEILKETVLSSNGTILKLSTLSGQSINAGNKKFGEQGSREFARYESGIRELVDLGYVKDQSGKNEIFTLTHEGWLRAEKL